MKILLVAFEGVAFKKKLGVVPSRVVIIGKDPCFVLCLDLARNNALYFKLSPAILYIGLLTFVDLYEHLQTRKYV